MKIIIILVGMILLALPAQAMQVSYLDNQCELIAKDYQKEYGGSLVFIQPLKDNGAYDFGAYNGHWINKAYNKQQGIYYIDYASNTTLKSKEEVSQWYEMVTSKKVAIFVLNEGSPPFGLIWHY